MTLEQFALDLLPNPDRRRCGSWQGISFAHRARNLVILGPLVVGDTYLAAALGGKAVEVGYWLPLLSLETLMTQLMRAHREYSLERAIQ